MKKIKLKCRKSKCNPAVSNWIDGESFKTDCIVCEKEFEADVETYFKNITCPECSKKGQKWHEDFFDRYLSDSERKEYKKIFVGEYSDINDHSNHGKIQKALGDWGYFVASGNNSKYFAVYKKK